MMEEGVMSGMKWPLHPVFPGDVPAPISWSGGMTPPPDISDGETWTREDGQLFQWRDGSWWIVPAAPEDDYAGGSGSVVFPSATPRLGPEGFPHVDLSTLAITPLRVKHPCEATFDSSNLGDAGIQSLIVHEGHTCTLKRKHVKKWRSMRHRCECGLEWKPIIQGVTEVSIPVKNPVYQGAW